MLRDATLCVAPQHEGVEKVKSKLMKKPIPTFNTDREAEEFVANADLTDYDLSGGQIVRFEMRPKDKAVSLRLPEKLLDAIRGAAERQGMPYQRFIRMAIESALDKATRK
jgi:predicted DNA binding CopG/RHH family protein